MKTIVIIFSVLLISITVQSKENTGKNSEKSGVPVEVTWKNVSDNYGARCMIVNSKGHIIAGSWGALLSKDNGEQWVRKVLPNTSSEINSMAINSKDVIYATTFDYKLYRSTDDGNTWNQLFTDSTHISFSCVASNSLNEIFTGTEDIGIFRLSNNDDSLKITGWNSGAYRININKSDDMFISENPVWRSIDRANSWTKVPPGLENSVINGFVFNSQGHIFTGQVSISKDNGDNWIKTKYSYSNDDAMDSIVIGLICGPSDDLYIGTWSAGIIKLSSDGNTLTTLNTGLPVFLPQIVSFVFTPDGHILAGTIFNGIFKSVQVVSSVIKDYSSVPVFCTLEQNYPNPFNNNTTIKYSITRDIHTNIDIINQDGKLVKTLLHQNQAPGNYQISWDAYNNTPGVYFYRIKAGDYIITKKMLLIKKL